MDVLHEMSLLVMSLLVQDGWVQYCLNPLQENVRDDFESQDQATFIFLNNNARLIVPK